MDAPCAPRRLAAAELGALIQELERRGYTVLGPHPRDGAIVIDTLDGVDALPRGLGDEQAPGRYRLRPRADGAYFGYAVGPHSFRRQFQVPEERLVQLRRSGEQRFEVVPIPPRAPKLALFGARPCDVAALAIHDAVLTSGPVPDDRYVARRQDVFVVAVTCGDPAATCFCTSMGGGPRPGRGFDLALTELLEGEHRFLVEVGSEAGRAVVDALGSAEAPEGDLRAADEIAARASERIDRTLDTEDITALMERSYEHPRFDEVGQRCLACGSCSLVCPTCFCTRVDETTSLDGATAERVRRWDTCFSLDHSYMHGGPVRHAVGARYRQWLTHKLGAYQPQFGTPGCVGCGRCITWCPAGIDITEEAAAIRANPAPLPSKRIGP